MKKLLSLLSVLTISGTAVPTVIAASPYQKEETIKISDINYQQTNNLEDLIRVKRRDVLNYEFFAWEYHRLHFGFSTERWNQIKNAYNIANTIDEFIYKLTDVLNNGVWQDYRSENWSSRYALATVIWKKYSEINNTIYNSRYNNFYLVINHKETYYNFRTMGEPANPDTYAGNAAKVMVIAGTFVGGATAAILTAGAAVPLLLALPLLELVLGPVSEAQLWVFLSVAN